MSGTRLLALCSTRTLASEGIRFRRQARRFLDASRDEVSERTLENARLLVSELVANAVEHVHEDGEIELRVALADGVLRVEVLDPGPGFTPRPRPPDSDRGWGLHFIDRLADAGRSTATSARASGSSLLSDS